MESTNRNKQGRFVSGHKGAKPKGAINKYTRDYLARLDKINQLLETCLEDNILSLSKKEHPCFGSKYKNSCMENYQNSPNPNLKKSK
jgi:hypothetical protein